MVQCLNRCIALLFLDHGTRRRWGVSVTPLPHFSPSKYPVPIVQEAGWAPSAGLDPCAKSRLPPGFERRTFQPVASRYMDWSTGPTHTQREARIFFTSSHVRLIYWDLYNLSFHRANYNSVTMVLISMEMNQTLETRPLCSRFVEFPLIVCRLPPMLLYSSYFTDKLVWTFLISSQIYD